MLHCRSPASRPPHRSPMAIPTKLIFGIRTSQATKLVVTGGPTSTTLPLLITTRDTPTETSVPCTQGGWTADLMKGDHMVRIEISNENDWFEGMLKFAVSPGAAIVWYGPKGETSELAIDSWSAMEGTTGG